MLVETLLIPRLVLPYLDRYFTITIGVLFFSFFSLCILLVFDYGIFWYFLIFFIFLTYYFSFFLWFFLSPSSTLSISLSLSLPLSLSLSLSLPLSPSLSHVTYSDLSRMIGVDENLAHHVSHLFTRDPLVIFDGMVELDDEKTTDHFENIQSTNWQTCRYLYSCACSTCCVLICCVCLYVYIYMYMSVCVCVCVFARVCWYCSLFDD